jgi:hypothetical protein
MQPGVGKKMKRAKLTKNPVTKHIGTDVEINLIEAN